MERFECKERDSWLKVDMLRDWCEYQLFRNKHMKKPVFYDLYPPSKVYPKDVRCILFCGLLM
jgi:hypothetical protein